MPWNYLGLIIAKITGGRLGKVISPGLEMGFGALRNAEMRVLEIRLDWLPKQLHTLFGRRQIAFMQVTIFAGDHHIGPITFSATGFWNDMVDCKKVIAITTVLAGIIVPTQNIFLAESNNIFSIALHHFQNPYDSRQFKNSGWRTNDVAITFDFFRSAGQHHDNSSLGTAKLQRLIGKI